MKRIFEAWRTPKRVWMGTFSHCLRSGIPTTRRFPTFSHPFAEFWWSSARDGMHFLAQQWQMPTKMTQKKENATKQSSLNPGFPTQSMDTVK